MIRLVLALYLALCGVANAQLAGGLQFPGPGTAHSVSVPATFDAGTIAANITLSGGNLTATATAGVSFGASTRSTTGVSAQLKYFEVTITTNPDLSSCIVGIANAVDGVNNYPGSGTGGIGAVLSSGLVLGGPGGNVSSVAVGDVVGVALNDTARLIWWRTIHAGSPGNWNNSGTDNPATNTGGISIAGLAAGPYFAQVSFAGNTDRYDACFATACYAAAAPAGYGNF